MTEDETFFNVLSLLMPCTFSNLNQSCNNSKFAGVEGNSAGGLPAPHLAEALKRGRGFDGQVDLDPGPSRQGRPGRRLHVEGESVEVRPTRRDPGHVYLGSSQKVGPAEHNGSAKLTLGYVELETVTQALHSLVIKLRKFLKKTSK